MSLPSDNDIFIPLPTPVEDNGTPILKWVLSRPNAHLLPLHLLTTARSLDVANEEIVVGYKDDDSGEDYVNSVSFDSSSFFDYDENPEDVDDEQGFEYEEERGMEEEDGEEGEKEEAEAEEEEGDLKEEKSPIFSSFTVNDVFLQNPHEASSSSMNHEGDQRVSSPPPSISTVSSIFPVLPPILHQLIGLSLLLQRQREFLEMQQLQQATLLHPLLQPLQIEESSVMQPPGLLLHPLQRAREELAHDLEENGEETIDVGRRDEREYTPVLPPSSVVVTKTEDDVSNENDAIKTDDETVLQKAQRIIASYSNNTRSFSKGTKQKRQPRLILTKRQKNVFNGIMARHVSHLWPSERTIIAKAFGITEKQVLNVFINRGGRAAQRREVGLSTHETQRIIREELVKYGFTP